MITAKNSRLNMETINSQNGTITVATIEFTFAYTHDGQNYEVSTDLNLLEYQACVRQGLYDAVEALTRISGRLKSKIKDYAHYEARFRRDSLQDTVDDILAPISAEIIDYLNAPDTPTPTPTTTATTTATAPAPQKTAKIQTNGFTYTVRVEDEEGEFLGGYEYNVAEYVGNIDKDTLLEEYQDYCGNSVDALADMYVDGDMSAMDDILQDVPADQVAEIRDEIFRLYRWSLSIWIDKYLTDNEEEEEEE